MLRKEGDENPTDGGEGGGRPLSRGWVWGRHTSMVRMDTSSHKKVLYKCAKLHI